MPTTDLQHIFAAQICLGGCAVAQLDEESIGLVGFVGAESASDRAIHKSLTHVIEVLAEPTMYPPTPKDDYGIGLPKHRAKSVDRQNALRAKGMLLARIAAAKNLN